MRRPSSFSLSLSLSLMLWASLPAAAEESQSQAPEASLGISVRVYNYAQVAPEILTKAEKEAEKVFRKVRIHLEWPDCPLSMEELQNFPACEQEIGVTDLILGILTHFKTGNSNLHSTSLGFAHPERNTAHVSLERVKHLALFGYADEPEVLGHAIAHELGHLLLGSNLHSADGLMRAHWGPKESQAATDAGLVFTSRQAKVIRAEVAKRVGQCQQALGLSGAKVPQ